MVGPDVYIRRLFKYIDADDVVLRSIPLPDFAKMEPTILFTDIKSESLIKLSVVPTVVLSDVSLNDVVFSVIVASNTVIVGVIL